MRPGVNRVIQFFKGSRRSSARRSGDPRRASRWVALAIGLVASTLCLSIAPWLAAASGAVGPTLVETIADIQAKVVKIYGAGGFQGLEAYQSGFLISPEGHVLTVWS